MVHELQHQVLIIGQSQLTSILQLLVECGHLTDDNTRNPEYNQPKLAMLYMRQRWLMNPFMRAATVPNKLWVPAKYIIPVNEQNNWLITWALSIKKIINEDLTYHYHLIYFSTTLAVSKMVQLPVRTFMI